MRIIAGAWRGRPLLAPTGDATRPTSDRAREALFSMLQSRLGSFEDLAVVDLFAGTGALGLEALSRGAATCTFVETGSTALATLRSNIAKLGAADRADARPRDATRVTGGPWHLAFLDPPYDSGLADKALANLLATNSLATGALVSVETARAEPLDATGYGLEAERGYGKARITLLRAP